MKWNPFHKNELSSLAWLSLVFVALVAALCLVYFYFLHDLRLVILLVNIVFAMALYGCLTFYFYTRSRRVISRMTAELQRLGKDLVHPDNIPETRKTEEALQPFYDELDDLSRTVRNREQVRQELMAIVNSVAINMEFEKLLEDLMPRLIDITQSSCCAFYAVNQATSKLEIKQSLGFGKNIYGEFDIGLGEGLVGTAAVTRKTIVLQDIPDDTIYLIRTFLGKIKPRSILVVPIENQDILVGVLAFATLYSYTPEILDMVELIKRYLGVAVANGNTYERTKRLTNELKFQNKLIQDLNEELEKKVQDRILYLNIILDSIEGYTIYALDKAGVVILWNRGAERLFEVSADEAMGRNIESLYPQEETDAIRKRLQTVLREGRLVETGTRARQGNILLQYEMTMFTMNNEKNQVTGVTCLIRDVSSSKRLESALRVEQEISRQVIESSSRALVQTDESGIILLANANAESLLDSEEMEGRGIYEFFDQFENLQRDIQTAVSSSYSEDLRYRLRSGAPGEDTSLAKGNGDMVLLRLIVLGDEGTGIKKVMFFLRREE